jgi:hypothetical protein
MEQQSIKTAKTSFKKHNKDNSSLVIYKFLQIKPKSSHLQVVIKKTKAVGKAT